MIPLPLFFALCVIFLCATYPAFKQVEKLGGKIGDAIRHKRIIKRMKVGDVIAYNVKTDKGDIRKEGEIIYISDSKHICGIMPDEHSECIEIKFNTIIELVYKSKSN